MKRLALIFASVLTGCSLLIDEDWSDCGGPLGVDYELRLITNMRTELATVLSLDASVKTVAALDAKMSETFVDYAHDVNLSFYDLYGDMPLLQHMTRKMEANETSYIFSIPAHDYLHTGIANFAECESVALEGEGFCKSERLVQKQENGYAESHGSGVFTARKKMEVLTGISQTFEVSLYMVNSASALIIDASEFGVAADDVRVEVSGFADSFYIADSLYTYNSDPHIKAKLVPIEDSSDLCFAAVHFPSRDPNPETKVVIQVDDDEYVESSSEPLWQWTVYVTLKDGSVTQSVLHVYESLPAGHLKVVRARMYEQGTVKAEDPLVGVSVVLDWQPGSSHDITM